MNYNFSKGLIDSIDAYLVTTAANAAGISVETNTLLVSGLKARITRVRDEQREQVEVGETPTQMRDCIAEDTAVFTDENAEYRVYDGSLWYDVLRFHRQRNEKGRYHHVSLRLRVRK